MKESYAYTYNRNNLIVSETIKNDYREAAEDKVDQSKEYTYNKNGNRLTEENSVTNEKKEFTYDADNRLSRYVAKNGSNISLAINGETTETTKEHPYWVEGQGWIPQVSWKKVI